MAKKQAVTIAPKEFSPDTSPKTFTHKPLSNGMIPAKISLDDLKEYISDVDLSFKNYPFPGCMEAFPHQPAMRTCDRYYPAGKNGPVFVDEPMFDEEIKLCEEKAKHIRKSGAKYIILTKETDLHSALEQIGLT